MVCEAPPDAPGMVVGGGGGPLLCETLAALARFLLLCCGGSSALAPGSSISKPTVANLNEPIRHGGKPGAIFIVASLSITASPRTSTSSHTSDPHQSQIFSVKDLISDRRSICEDRIERRVFNLGRADCGKPLQLLFSECRERSGGWGVRELCAMGY